MAEEINGQIYEAKSGWNGDVQKNFILPNELTVTITLGEYRALIKSVADAKISETQSENYKLRTEISELKKEINVLENLVKGANENA